MLDKSAHLDGAGHNKALATSLLGQGEASWAAVLAFYSALHYIDAYLADRGFRAGDHQRRSHYISTLRDLGPVGDPYRRLEVRAWWVRYELRVLDKAEVEALINKDLQQIEEHVLSLLR